MFITNVLAPMVDDIFLCVDLDRKDFCVTKNKESIAFLLRISDLVSLFLCLCCAEQCIEGREEGDDLLHRLDEL